MVSAGDFYSYGAADAFVFAALGYDGLPKRSTTSRSSTTSWGSSSVHNDGWDGTSRAIDSLTRPVNPVLSVFFSVGNGSPGFGTVAPPSPPSAILVGASTQHGSTGWDDAAGADQITYGDVASFSGRGPGARGDTGVSLVGSGSRASGSVPVNEAMSGWHAWTTWGGTSRSAPVVAGNAALVYQAFYETYGFWPNYEIVKMLLMNGATDLHTDPLLQGAGSVNALASVELATGDGGFLTYPFEWIPGDYHCVEWPGFANIVHPGGSYEESFQFSNPTDQTVHLSITDQWMQKTGTHEFDWSSSPVDVEPITLAETPVDTEYEWDTPHYLWNVTDLVPEGTDMVVMRFNYPFDQFDPDFSYPTDQTNSWYLTSYDWTDVNGDGDLWTDTNGNGVIDDGELDAGEYVRLEYSNQRATTHYITVGDPQQRIHDGLFFGMQHSQARADIPVTDFTIGLDFYENVDMPWITVSDQAMTSVPPLSTNRLEINLDVPGDTPIGIYEASLLVSDGYHETTVPVVINVASNNLNVTAGQEMYSNFESQAYYNNEWIYGAQSWRGREEGGDWRFFVADLPENPGLFESKMPDGSFFYLADAKWESELSDVDIHVFSPFVDQVSTLDPDFYGPYTLAPSASSNNAYVGNGTYRLDTSSGTSREVIAAPYIPGLNAIALHNTNFAGTQPAEALELRTGVLGVSQAPMDVTTTAGSDRTYQQSVMSSIELSGLEIQGFGLSKPDARTAVPIQQDDPNDPSTSSYTQEITLENAGLLDIQVVGGENDDIDLYLIQDLNGDGEFDFATEQVAASTTSTAQESITIQLPEDGNYLIAVHGWAVPPDGSTFDISTLAVQGDGISTSGAPEGSISPNRVYNFDVAFDTEGLEAGAYTGLVTIGPPEGPSAVLVFANVTIE
ncbi:MAG: S8 family serine peptidase [Thermomicrobiales bacterium]